MRDALLKVLPQIDLIANKALRAKVIEAWEIALSAGGIEPGALDEMPFSLLARTSGISLAEHIRAVVSSAVALAEQMKATYGEKIRVDRDILICGALVHDIGKVVEYEEGPAGYRKSDYGRLLRHPFSGVWICQKAGLPAEVLHIVAVHSKEGDLGFRTVEASIIHHCDFANFEPFRDDGSKG